MENTKSWWIAAIIGGIAILTAGYFLAPGSDEGASDAAASATTPGVIDGPAPVMFASWAEGYSNIPDMSKASAAVVTGKVVGHTQEVRQKSGGPALYSDFDFLVSRSFKGEAGTGKHITVHQTGGVHSDGSAEEFRDDPLLESGVDYLLFLKYDPLTDHYFVAGGPMGRFVVKDGAIIPLSEIYPDRPIFDIAVSGRSLAEVAAQVR